MSDPLLVVDGLVTEYESDLGWVRAVDGISFELERGRTLALVGESGCGKSAAALSIAGLLPENGRVAGGAVRFEGRDLVSLPERALRAVRGRHLGMIFQEPASALHPVMTIGAQIEETLRAHLSLSRARARERALSLLDSVGIPSPRARIDQYPHELSGGMKQRVMIAMAIACEPKLLIADEATTALDATIRAQVLELIAKLSRELGLAVLSITHDLGIVRDFADDVVVMYAGRIVERASTARFYRGPSHPYASALLACVDSLAAIPGPPRLPSIPGSVGDARSISRGCRFQPRCERAIAECREIDPPLETPDRDPHHLAACIRPRVPSGEVPA